MRASPPGSSSTGTELVELDEILGYHLGQALCTAPSSGCPRRRAGRGGEAAPDLRRPSRGPRQDYRAAVSLFERAAALVPAERVRPRPRDRARRRLLWAIRQSGRRAPARRFPRRACRSRGRPGGRALREDPSVCDPPHRRAGGCDREAWRARRGRRCRCFEAAGDDLALYIAYHALGPSRILRGRDRCSARGIRGRRRPRPARGHPADSSLGARATSLLGTTPVSELLAWLDENERDAGRTTSFSAYRRSALAMLGRFDEARAILAEDRAEQPERGGELCSPISPRSSPSRSSSWLAIPPQPPSSERRGARLHQELAKQAFLSTAAAIFARALYALDRLDEADAWATRAAELGASDDLFTQDPVAAGQGEGARPSRRARGG